MGLYAAPAALILYAAFGSSRHLVVGPMSATAALSAAIVAELTTQGSETFVALTVALAITTGIAALVAGLLRLGFFSNFISEPVLKGFIVGLALTIIVGRLPSAGRARIAGGRGSPVRGDAPSPGVDLASATMIRARFTRGRHRDASAIVHITHDVAAARVAMEPEQEGSA